MGYALQKLTGDTYKEKILDYKYAFVYNMSEMFLVPVEKLPEFDWEECLEARFFSDTGELHIFEGEDGMEAVEVKDTDEKDILVKSYKLNEKFSSMGTCIYVQEYLTYDEDGQLGVALTRLKGIGTKK